MEINELDLVWGAREIGRVIGRTERQTFYLLEIGAIKCAKKAGTQYVASRAALRRELAGETEAA
jgi:hypothetical protein